MKYALKRNNEIYTYLSTMPTADDLIIHKCDSYEEVKDAYLEGILIPDLLISKIDENYSVEAPIKEKEKTIEEKLIELEVKISNLEKINP